MCPPAGLEYERLRGERPAAMRVWLLGGFEVSVGQRTVGGGTWRLRKAAALVKLLALAPGHRVHREQIMDRLWPDLGRKAASNNLRRVLHTARKIIDADAGSHYLASEYESLVLCPGGDLWVDVDAFEEAAATARRSQDPAACRAALDLYAGELLPEDRYAEWSQDRREQLRRLNLDLLVELARLHEGRGEDGAAIEALSRALAIEPSLEQAHLDLMRLHAIYRRRGEALAQYERLRETQQRYLGTEPDASVRALKEEIAAGRFPPPEQQAVRPTPEGALDADKHNLPAPRTSFVGRERELLEINRALAMTRLLTLTGVGGSGKTRLALEVAKELVGIYPDGVWLIELAPLSEIESVPQAVAGALGMSERPGESLIDTLVDYLRRKQALLVLDNCEHVIEDAARLADVLLSSCPELRILATSREALNVVGEVGWPVPTLLVPEPKRSLTVDELEGFESARLFLERASERRPGFALVPEEAPSVAEICRTLEGMPLAIELTAATVRTLSIGQISERLANSLGLLTGGGRTLSPRQRSLRGALDWSHALLSGPEKVLFRRLSVFAGGWTLEAAEAVVFGRGVEQNEVLALLSALVDKSLVAVEVSKGNEIRYRLLEPVRQYAAEKLVDCGETETTRRRHAAFFVARAEEAEPRLLTPNRKVLESLEAEHDNIRAALSWSLEPGETELGLRLAGALRWFWFARGYLGDGRMWLEELLRNGERTAARIKALLAMSMLANQQGDHDEAEAAAEEGLKLGADLGVEGRLRTELLQMLGSAVSWRGDYDRAKELLEEALSLSRKAGDRWGVSLALNLLGNMSYMEGDIERAAKIYQECLDLLQERGDAAHSAIILNNLASIALDKGAHERATALSEQASTLFREQGHTKGLESSLAIRGWAALMREDHEEAKASLKESLALCRDLGTKLHGIDVMEGLACSFAAQGRAEHAARLFGAVQALYEGVGYNQSPEDRAQRAPYMEAARSRLGEAAWEAAFSDGQVMGVEEAIEYALSDPTTTDPTTTDPSIIQQHRANTPTIALTRREQDIATLVARGLTNRQIASELSISEHTAATHVRRILKKLGLRSRAQIGSWLTERPSAADPN
jgi:predicted ATPase/DNA-binding SARP family transcriptional activator/DNA-binding CsgD family transcriptional regulator